MQEGCCCTSFECHCCQQNVTLTAVQRIELQGSLVPKPCHGSVELEKTPVPTMGLGVLESDPFLNHPLG